MKRSAALFKKQGSILILLKSTGNGLPEDRSDKVTV
jgi:hypothetical protein